MSVKINTSNSTIFFNKFNRFVSISADTSPVEKLVYIPVQDTISERSNIATIIRLEHDLALTQDSLRIAKDSIGEDLIVARIKLARIKEYNRIAGKGNNILVMGILF